MIVACPYCAGVIVLDDRKVTAVSMDARADSPMTPVSVSFIATHRCAPTARREWVEWAT